MEIVMIQAENGPDFLFFLGRFHPLIVHLPIGFLLLAVLMEVISQNPKYANLKPAVPFSLLVGAISAAIACLLGYLLSLEGGYNEDALSNHQWMGIILTAVSFLAWVVASGKLPLPRAAFMGVFVVMMGLLTFTGHLGGNLTHGSGYLTQYLPQPIKDLAGIKSYKPKERRKITNLDSALVFEDVVMPMLEQRCVSCHNPEKVKGNLLMISHEELLKGGKSGGAIVPNELEKSELFRRVTLPETHDEFMPPEGKTPLADEQVEILKWWILQGAEKGALVANYTLEENIKKSISGELGLDKSSNSLPAIAENADAGTIDQVQQQGFTVQQIAMEMPHLEVRPTSGRTRERIELPELLKVKDQVVWLDLAGMEINDKDLEIIGQLTNLVRLRLERNPLSGSGLQHLSTLTHLEYLNLYGTEITDEQLSHLEKISSLKRLYLWQTAVTNEGVEKLKSANPELQIVLGDQASST